MPDQEPNNTSQTAIELGDLSTPASVQKMGEISNIGDIDWYRFTLTTRRVLRITFPAVDAGIGYWLFSSDASTILASGVTPAVTMRTLDAGTYFVRFLSLTAPSFSDNTGDAQSWRPNTAINSIPIPRASGVPVPAYISSGVPAGITVALPTATADGSITGTPTSVSSGTITITATNAGGADTWTIAYNTVLADAVAPTVTINAVAEGNEGTNVRLRATISGGLYDSIFYVWTVGGGTLDQRFPATPTWTRPAVTADGTSNINLEIHVAGTGTRAASGTSDSSVATTLAAAVRNVPVITTNIDEIFRLAATQPAPPIGGTSTQTYTPTDWTRSKPNPTATQTVWRAQRTRSYGDGSFASASAWSTPARIYHDIWLAGYRPNRIYRSINNGASWGSAISGPSGQTFINGIAVAPNGDLWLAGDTPDRIYHSKDSGATWGSAISGPSGQSLISGIAVALNGDLWLVGSTPDDIYRSTDGGSTWSSAGISGPSGQGAIAGIAVAPNGDLWLAGSIPDDIYRSTDNGKTWGSGIDGPSLQSRISGISVAPNGDIWLCGSRGNDIYRSTDNGANWSAEIDGPSGQNRISGIAVNLHIPPVVVTLSASASAGTPIARAALVAAVLSASVMAGVPTARADIASTSISIKASTSTPSTSANLLPGPLAISASSRVPSASADIIKQSAFDLSWTSEGGRTVYVSAVVTAGVPRGNGTVYENQPGRTPLGSVSADSDMESQTGQSVTAIALNELFTGNITFWDAPSPLAWSSFFTDNPDVSLWMQFAPRGPIYPFVARGHGGSYSAWATGDTAAQAAVTAARAEGARFAFVLRGAPAVITLSASSTAGVPTARANLQQPTLSISTSAATPTARADLRGQLLSATASAGVPTATIDIEEQGVGINAYVPPSGYWPIVLAFLEADVSGGDITAEPVVTIGTGNDLIVASDLVISQVERHVAGAQIRLRRSGDGEFSTYFDNEGSPLYPDARLQILYDGSLIDGSIDNTGGGFNNWSVANSAQRSKLNAIATGERFVLAILKKVVIEASASTIAPSARVALVTPSVAVDASAGVPSAKASLAPPILSVSVLAGTPTARADLVAVIISISASAGTPTARAALIPPTISLTATTNTPTAKARLASPTLSASASAATPTARARLASLVLTTADIDITNLDVYALALINTGTPTGATGTIYRASTNLGSIDVGGDLTARPGQDITRIGLNPQGSGTLRFWDNPSEQSWINFFSAYPRATLRLQFEITGPAYELTRGSQGGNFSNWSTSNADARAAIASARADGKKFIFLLAEITVRAGEGEKASVAAAGAEGVGRKIDAATHSGSGEFGESATEGVEGTGNSQTAISLGEGEVGRVTASATEGQGASVVIRKVGSGEFGRVVTAGMEGAGNSQTAGRQGEGEVGQVTTSAAEGRGTNVVVKKAGSGEFGKVIITGAEGAGVGITPLPTAGSGEFSSVITSGKEGVGRRNAARTLSGTGEFGTVSSGGTEGGGRFGGSLAGFTKVGEVRGVSFPRTGADPNNSYGVVLRARDTSGNIGDIVDAGSITPIAFVIGTAVWYTGVDVPPDTLGKDGDLYLRINSNDIYHKVNGSWVLRVNLSRATAKWYSGMGTPSNTLGVNGDYYFDSNNALIYEKVSGAWVATVDIDGEDGKTWHGVDGIPPPTLGVVGDWAFRTDQGYVYEKTGPLTWTFRTDLNGPQGIGGATWHTGVGTPSNSLGVDGDLYFRTSDNSVYKKSSGLWAFLSSLEGADGATWFSGSRAPSSGLGNDNDWYFRTGTGAVAGSIYKKISGSWVKQVDIDQGRVGSDGSDGTDGRAGAAGRAGSDGATWHSGSASPSSGLGSRGDWYFRTSNGYVYEKTSGSRWTFRRDITGPQGARGAAGASSNITSWYDEVRFVNWDAESRNVHVPGSSTGKTEYRVLISVDFTESVSSDGSIRGTADANHGKYVG